MKCSGTEATNTKPLVYQIDEGRKRLLWIGPDRTAKTLLRFFRFLGKDRTKQLQFICSDMWQAYLKVIRKKASQAIRSHLMKEDFQRFWNTAQWDGQASSLINGVHEQ